MDSCVTRTILESSAFARGAASRNRGGNLSAHGRGRRDPGTNLEPLEIHPKHHRTGFENRGRLTSHGWQDQDQDKADEETKKPPTTRHSKQN